MHSTTTFNNLKVLNKNALKGGFSMLYRSIILHEITKFKELYH